MLSEDVRSIIKAYASEATDMRKPMTATELRKDIYRVLDDVLETGIPQEVIRGSRTLMLVPAGGRRIRLDDLPRREALNCTPDELVETSWDWTPEL